MYSDPKQIRKHPVKIRFTDPENELINKIVNLDGGQRTTVLRKILIKGIMKEHEMYLDPSNANKEGANKALCGS